MPTGSAGGDEYYVTASNLRSRTAGWRKEIAPFNLHRMKVDPERSCLMVVDMQNYFLDPASPTFTPGGLAILSNVARLIKAFRSRKLPVIYTNSCTSASFFALTAESDSRSIGLGVPPTRNIGCGFLPPKMACSLTTSRCHSRASM